VKRWVDEVGARPAVERGRHHHKEWGERQLSEEEQKRRKELLFNQTNEKVRAAREAAAKAASWSVPPPQPAAASCARLAGSTGLSCACDTRQWWCQVHVTPVSAAGAAGPVFPSSSRCPLPRTALAPSPQRSKPMTAPLAATPPTSTPP